jgi:hypothetical protein
MIWSMEGPVVVRVFGGNLLRDQQIRDRWLAGYWHWTGGLLDLSRPTLRTPASRSRLPLVPSVSVAVLALALLVATRPAFAGPNEGGVLILHCNPTLQFTADANFDGYAELYDAKDAVTQVPGDGQGVVYFVLAAFDDFAMPRLKGISFGIELSSPTVEPIRWGTSAEVNLIIPTKFWPSSGSGISIDWEAPFVRRVNEIFWFCGYAYAGQTVKLVKHPVDGGRMADDSFPREITEIAGYGMLGFGVKGFNPLVNEVATGACCSEFGRCILQTAAGCQPSSGYHYLGDNTNCSPNSCTSGTRLDLVGPNPFGEQARIEFELPSRAEMSLVVYDAFGREVRILRRGLTGAGRDFVDWDGRDGEGRRLPAGIYICRMKTSAFARSVRLVWLPAPESKR